MTTIINFTNIYIYYSGHALKIKEKDVQGNGIKYISVLKLVNEKGGNRLDLSLV